MRVWVNILKFVMVNSPSLELTLLCLFESFGPFSNLGRLVLPHRTAAGVRGSGLLDIPTDGLVGVDHVEQVRPLGVLPGLLQGPPQAPCFFPELDYG